MNCRPVIITPMPDVRPSELLALTVPCAPVVISKRTDCNAAEFTRLLTRQIARGMGVPPEFFHDCTGVPVGSPVGKATLPVRLS